MIEAKRLGRVQWSNVGDDPTCGYMLFVDNPADWAKCMAALVEVFETGKLPADPSVLDPINMANRGAA